MNDFLEKLRTEGIPVKNDGMCDCPKCGGSGMVNYHSWEEIDEERCPVCLGIGTIAPKVYRKYRRSEK